MKSKHQSGFTLIELMIVVTLIGILAAIAVPAYQDYTIRTRVNESTGIFLPVKTATALHYSDNGYMPRALVDLTRYGISDNETDHSGDYVEKLEVCDKDVADCATEGAPGDISTGIKLTLRSAGDGQGDQLGDATGKDFAIWGTVEGATIRWEINAGASGLSDELETKFHPNI